ncbi:MAG: hypothetical protein MUD01_01255 [Chloroflexaceae bacterium]|jgi:hypothetical protein|nr:hypothetical protein [Chloroflexaceae bacterium]
MALGWLRRIAAILLLLLIGLLGLVLSLELALLVVVSLLIWGGLGLLRRLQRDN